MSACTVWALILAVAAKLRHRILYASAELSGLDFSA